MQQPVTFTSSVLGPYERGLELGERFADRIRDTVAAYRRLFAARADHPFDVDAWAERAWAAIATAVGSPYSEEIRGIADGAGRPVRELAAVNARTELLVAANPSGVTECSSVVAAPPGRSPFAVQTWDWYHAMSDGWFHWTIPHADGRRVETVTEFGMLAKVGVNADGVGVMLNMLHHRNDAGAADDGIGHPVHLLSRRILDEARSFDDAAAIVKAGTSASTALTVLDRSGAAATFELFPGGPGRFDAADGLLVRTNHFLSPEGRGGCLAATISDSSALRRATLVEAFAADPPASPDQVVTAMTDHGADGAGGVCAHPDASTDPVLWHRTLATVVLDVERGRLDVQADGPCGHRDADPGQEPRLTRSGRT